jgi:hypothetical protein
VVLSKSKTALTSKFLDQFIPIIYSALLDVLLLKLQHSPCRFYDLNDKSRGCFFLKIVDEAAKLVEVHHHDSTVPTTTSRFTCLVQSG